MTFKKKIDRLNCVGKSLIAIEEVDEKYHIATLILGCKYSPVGDYELDNSESVFDYLDEERQKGFTNEELYLLAKGFISKTARTTGTPLHGHFELTPLCNLNCKMCYVHLNDSQLAGKQLLSAETWIDLMQQAIDAGMTSVNLSGGECLTYPYFDDVFLFLKQKGVDVFILTNGVLLNEERITFFKKNCPQMIQISLYGNSEEAYERVTGKRVFSTVLNNIIAAKDAGLPIKLAITPNSFMSDTIKDTIQLAKDLDVFYTLTLSLLTPRTDTGRSKGDADISLDEYIDIFTYNRILNGNVPIPQELDPIKEGRECECSSSGVKCGAGRNGFSIRWDGRMHPCSQMDSIAVDPVKLGFQAAWEIINREVNSFPRFKKCDNCDYSDACLFCAAENEKMGSRYSLNPEWCERTVRMIKSGLKKPKA